LEPLKAAELVLAGVAFALLIGLGDARTARLASFSGSLAAIVGLALLHIHANTIVPMSVASLVAVAAVGGAVVLDAKLPTKWFIAASAACGAVYALSAYELIFFNGSLAQVLIAGAQFSVFGFLGMTAMLYVRTSLIGRGVVRIVGSWILAASILLAAFAI